jgi:hypothetical protein
MSLEGIKRKVDNDMARDLDAYPLNQIVDMLPEDLNVSKRQLWEWSRRPRNDFPKPVKTLGRFTFYSYQEVVEWVVLWRRATERIVAGHANKKVNGLRNQKGKTDG